MKIKINPTRSGVTQVVISDGRTSIAVFYAPNLEEAVDAIRTQHDLAIAHVGAKAEDEAADK